MDQEHIKYQRTLHLPFSNLGKGDRYMESTNGFVGKGVVITEKRDGENTTLYQDGIHARALSYTYHPSREKMKALWGAIRYQIPKGYRVCGENLCGVHSIHYKDLPAFFQVISVWEGGRSLSWDDTLEWCKVLGLAHVPMLYQGVWDEGVVKNLITTLDTSRVEGFVVRVSDSFMVSEFPHLVGKYVRPDHVQCDDKHWSSKPYTPNGVVYTDMNLVEAQMFGRSKS